MKVLLIRLGVLGSLVVLGWITMANAQRGSDRANPLRASAPPVEQFKRTAGLAAAPSPTRSPTPRPLGYRRRATPASAVAVSASIVPPRRNSR